jgi:UDPglucose 6-dehydrogenase
MISIIGLGTVGRSMRALFPSARIYDPTQGYEDTVEGIAFVCVPTPEAPDGSCDTSIVEAAMEHDADLFVIRSTVPPGTTRRLRKPAVFQPEFLGMTPGHPYRSDADVPFVILGGHQTEIVADLYRTVLPPDTAYHHTTFETAELVKYAVNTFLATKVEFANELYDACAKLGVDYDAFRELWLVDERIGRSHTAVDPGHRGFDGMCFPKDIAAIVSWATEAGLELPVIRAAAEANRPRVAA